MNPWIKQYGERASAALLLVIVAAVMVTAAVGLFQHYDERVGDLTALKQRYERILTQRPGLENRLSAEPQAFATAQSYLNADSPALATARLLEIAGEYVRASAAQLASTRVLETVEDDSGFRRVAVRIQMTGGYGDIADVLYRIESGQPVIMIENLELLATNTRARVVRAQIERRGEVTLRTTFDLIGFMTREDGS